MLNKKDKVVGLYIKGKISIGRGAEISNMSTSDFKELLARRGFVRTVKSIKKKVKKGILWIEYDNKKLEMARKNSLKVR